MRDMLAGQCHGEEDGGGCSATVTTGCRDAAADVRVSLREALDDMVNNGRLALPLQATEDRRRPPLRPRTGSLPDRLPDVPVGALRFLQEQGLIATGIREAVREAELRKTQQQQLLHQAGERGQKLLAEEMELDLRLFQIRSELACMRRVPSNGGHASRRSSLGDEMAFGRTRSLSFSSSVDGCTSSWAMEPRPRSCSSGGLALELHRLHRQNKDLEEELEEREAELSALETVRPSNSLAEAETLVAEVAQAEASAKQKQRAQQRELELLLQELQEQQQHTTMLCDALKDQTQVMVARNTKLKGDLRTARHERLREMLQLEDSVEQLRREATAQWQAAMTGSGTPCSGGGESGLPRVLEHPLAEVGQAIASAAQAASAASAAQARARAPVAEEATSAAPAFTQEAHTPAKAEAADGSGLSPWSLSGLDGSSALSSPRSFSASLATDSRRRRIRQSTLQSFKALRSPPAAATPPATVPASPAQGGGGSDSPAAGEDKDIGRRWQKEEQQEQQQEPPAEGRIAEEESSWLGGLLKASGEAMDAATGGRLRSSISGEWLGMQQQG